MEDNLVQKKRGRKPKNKDSINLKANNEDIIKKKKKKK